MNSEFISWNIDLILKQYGTNDFKYFGGIADLIYMICD